MKMFLVCMCDIFLILYLTNLGQVNRDAVSDLTVADYLELKKVEGQLKQNIAEQKKKLGLLDEELGQAKQELVFKISALKETERELSQKNFAEYKFNKTLETKEEKAKRLEQKFLAEQRAKAAAEEARQEALEQMEAEKVKALEEERLRKQKEEELRRVLADLKVEKKRLEAARLETQQLAERKEEAERLRLKAEVNLKVSRSHTKVARQKEKAAKDEAKIASTIAQESKVKAQRAEEAAEIAMVREEQAKEVLSTVVAPKEQAYVSHVKNRIVPLTVSARSENVILGSTEDEEELKGVITAIYGTQVVFVPREDSGVPDKDDVERSESYFVSIDGVPVTRLLVLPGEDRVIGFVVPTRKTLKLPKQDMSKLVNGLMPTLFAIRNQGPRRLSDRLRGLSEDFFVFKRERLADTETGFRYKAEGFRGTGDFAERIITGDTVVDFAGEVIAVADDENSLVKIDKKAAWQVFPIAGKDAKEVFKGIWQVIERK